MEKEIELDLMSILQMLWSRIFIIILLTACGGIIAAAVTHFLIPTLYTARVSMYVYNTLERRETNINDINMSVKLVGTYLVILNSDSVLTEVANESGLDYTAGQIKGMISAAAVGNTEVFEVKVKSETPEHARIIADTIAKVAPKEIIRVVKAGSVEIIDYAQQNPPKTSPNNFNNMVLGAGLGFIISIGFVLLEQTFDKTVKSEKDLSDIFGYPVLGSIPSMRMTRSEAYKYGRNQQYK